jgi:hypothetical protein
MDRVAFHILLELFGSKIEKITGHHGKAINCYNTIPRHWGELSRPATLSMMFYLCHTAIWIVLTDGRTDGRTDARTQSRHMHVLSLSQDCVFVFVGVFTCERILVCSG